MRRLASQRVDVGGKAASDVAEERVVDWRLWWARAPGLGALLGGKKGALAGAAMGGGAAAIYDQVKRH